MRIFESRNGIRIFVWNANIRTFEYSLTSLVNTQEAVFRLDITEQLFNGALDINTKTTKKKKKKKKTTTKNIYLKNWCFVYYYQRYICVHVFVVSPRSENRLIRPLIVWILLRQAKKLRPMWPDADVIGTRDIPKKTVGLSKNKNLHFYTPYVTLYETKASKPTVFFIHCFSSFPSVSNNVVISYITVCRIP